MQVHTNRIRNSKFILAWCIGLLEIIKLALLIFDCVDKPSNTWFHGFDYFTTQCSLMMLVFSILYLMDFKYKFIKSARWMNYVCAYAMVMFIIYNAILLPTVKMGDRNNTEWTVYWIESIISHEIAPLLLFTLLLLCGKYKQWIKTGRLWPTTGYGMIYPCCYAIYAILIPLSGSSNSVYGDFSNVWKTPAYICLILMVIALFFGGLVLSWYILNDWWILKEQPQKEKSKTK